MTESRLVHLSLLHTRKRTRSERESKALKTEAEGLKDKVAALRARLGGLQARRQAECELAAKKTEVRYCLLVRTYVLSTNVYRVFFLSVSTTVLCFVLGKTPWLSVCCWGRTTTCSSARHNKSTARKVVRRKTHPLSQARPRV